MQSLICGDSCNISWSATNGLNALSPVKGTLAKKQLCVELNECTTRPWCIFTINQYSCLFKKNEHIKKDLRIAAILFEWLSSNRLGKAKQKLGISFLYYLISIYRAANAGLIWHYFPLMVLLWSSQVFLLQLAKLSCTSNQYEIIK